MVGLASTKKYVCFERGMRNIEGTDEFSRGDRCWKKFCALKTGFNSADMVTCTLNAIEYHCMLLPTILGVEVAPPMTECAYQWI
jgi:hypothetical protein